MHASVRGAAGLYGFTLGLGHKYHTNQGYDTNGWSEPFNGVV